MKRRILCSVFLLCSVVGLMAQHVEEFSGSLLWKVTGNDLKVPSYIVGTHHLISESFIDSIPGLLQAVETTARTVGELDLSEMVTMQTKLMEAGIMPVGDSYKSLLSEEDYNRLDAELKGILGAGLDQFGNFKPGMINSIMSLVLFSQLYPDYNPLTHVGVDAQLQNMARERGKEVEGIETIDEQIHALFNAQPLKTQVEELLCSVDNFQTSVGKAAGVTDNYRNAELYKMYMESFHDTSDPCYAYVEASRVALLETRNNDWMTKLPEILQEKSNLIVVGALHLPGKEGLLYQLSRKGYKVEPVSE